MNVFIEKSRADPFFNYLLCLAHIPENKFKTFSDLFPIQKFLFPDSRLSDRSVVNRDLKNAGTKLFS